MLHCLGNTGFIKNKKKAMRLFMAENSSRSYHADYLKMGVFSRKYHCVLALFLFSSPGIWCWALLRVQRKRLIWPSCFWSGLLSFSLCISPTDFLAGILLLVFEKNISIAAFILPWAISQTWILGFSGFFFLLDLIIYMHLAWINAHFCFPCLDTTLCI